VTIAASIGNIKESEFVKVRIGLPRVKLKLSKLDSVNKGHFSLNWWRRIKNPRPLTNLHKFATDNQQYSLLIHTVSFTKSTIEMKTVIVSNSFIANKTICDSFILQSNVDQPL
jgi:hypothetical protein